MNEKARKRGIGRRKYNEKRQMVANNRRKRIVELLVDQQFEPGWQRRLAKDIGIDSTTVCRDINRITTDFAAGKLPAGWVLTASQMDAIEILVLFRNNKGHGRCVIDNLKKATNAGVARDVTQVSVKQVSSKRPQSPVDLKSGPSGPSGAEVRAPIQEWEHPYSISKVPSRFDGMGCFSTSNTTQSRR